RRSHNRRKDRSFGKGQVYSEPRTPSGPVAKGADRAAVHLHERAHQGQSNPETLRITRIARAYLGKHVKHMFEGLRRNTHSVVLNSDDRFVVLMVETERDASTGLGVFGGIQQ